MNTSRYKAVFVSPHLDDAVFSCGGEIARLAAEGPVLVLNLFTRYLGEVKHRGVVLGEARYREEAAAAQFLGFESHNFGELDAPFRQGTYQAPSKLFKPPVRDELNDYLPALRERVFAWLAGIDYERLYVPLGIGWHVDHVLAHLVFAPWIGRDALIHYEDAPYCLIPHATRHRLDELGAYPLQRNDATLAPAPAGRAWRATVAGYAGTALMKNLRPAVVRWAALPVVGFYLYRLVALHRRLGAASLPSRGLEPRIAPLDAVFARKLRAMQLYGSQFREFFTDAADCERLYRAYAARMGCPATAVERYWVMRPDAHPE